jgi:hypothetical protein
MPHEHTAPGSADEVSPPVLHVTAPSHVKGLVVGLGSLNGLSVGFIDFADCEPEGGCHSTVTDFARFLGLSTSVPRASAV